MRCCPSEKTHCRRASIIDSQTETWGIKVSNVEIRTVELTDNMVRAIAKQAEAERDRRAKIIHAEAEFQASQTLVNAAKILSSVPAAMQFRYLQTLAEIGAEQNSTVVFPMPIDIIKPFLDLLRQRRQGSRRQWSHSWLAYGPDAVAGLRSTALAMIIQPELGKFVEGVQTRVWQICAVGGARCSWRFRPWVGLTNRLCSWLPALA